MSWLAQNFDFTRGDTIVRLIAGIFLVPHIYSKLVGSGTVGFFKAAGFKPPAFWMYVACAIEASVAMSFLSNMYARYFGVLGAVHLLIAGAAVYRVSKGKWLRRPRSCPPPDCGRGRILRQQRQMAVEF